MKLVRSLTAVAFVAAAVATFTPRASAASPNHVPSYALGSVLRFVVGLTLRDEAGLDSLLAVQADPRSPLYRHYLTPAQVRAAFGVQPARYERVAAILRAHGFTVRGLGILGTALDVSGPASAAARYFSSAVRGDESAHALRRAAVPSELRGEVFAVAGTEAPSFRSPYGTRATLARGVRGAHAQTIRTSVAPDGGYGPQALEAAFDFPIRHGYAGRGATVADLWDGAFDDQYDLAPYLAEFRVARTGPRTSVVLVNGGCGGETGCPNSFAAAVDAEGIVGTSPAVRLLLYELPSLSDASILDGLDAILRDDRADVVNVSFAGCETQAGEGALLFDRAFKLGAAEGISFEGATYGGSHACPVAGPAVQAPADSPNILAVSGADTFVDANGRITRPPLGNVSSGGGYSALFAMPSFQAGVAGMLGTRRNVPDVAGPAAINSFGPSVYFANGGGWLGNVPFIYNAPLAGALAGAVEMHRGRIGALPARFYALAKNGYAKPKPYFTDVTLGCNGPYDSGPYCATPGYDRISGIGVPDMYAIATRL